MHLAPALGTLARVIYVAAVDTDFVPVVPMCTERTVLTHTRKEQLDYEKNDEIEKVLNVSHRGGAGGGTRTHDVVWLLTKQLQSPLCDPSIQ